MPSNGHNALDASSLGPKPDSLRGHRVVVGNVLARQELLRLATRVLFHLVALDCFVRHALFVRFVRMKGNDEK